LNTNPILIQTDMIDDKENISTYTIGKQNEFKNLSNNQMNDTFEKQNSIEISEAFGKQNDNEIPFAFKKQSSTGISDSYERHNGNDISDVYEKHSNSEISDIYKKQESNETIDIYEKQSNNEMSNGFEKQNSGEIADAYERRSNSENNMEDTFENHQAIENEEQQCHSQNKSVRKKERTLTEIENDVTKKWEEIKSCPKEDVDIAEKYYNDDSCILYVPTSIECYGIDEIKRVHSYKNYCGISTKDLSSEVIVNTTICGNTVIEEKILTLLHSRPIQWLLPGVQATGRRLVVPIVTIVTFNDDLFIKSKRIYWDQACVLKQVGLIPSILRCPFNGEDTDLPVKGIQQSDPLLTKEQFEEMNSMDILNRKLLKRQSYERFKDLRSDFINKNNSDSVKKLIEEKGIGVDESIQSDGRRRSYNTIDFKSKSDTLSGFLSGEIKEEFSKNEKITNKIFKKDRNDSKNISEIFSGNNLDLASNHGSNGGSSHSSKTKRMFRERLYQSDNIFEDAFTPNPPVHRGKRIFAEKSKDAVKISMEKSDSESDCVDSRSTLYDLDDFNSEKRSDSNNLSRQDYSSDEKMNESGYDKQEELINDQMKNLCLKNNYMDNNNEKKKLSKDEKRHKNHNHRVPIIKPYLKSSITFDNYGNIDLENRPKPKYRKKRVMPQFHSTFKIAYNKEELEEDNLHHRKRISPTYISHVFDEDNTVIKVRPIHKNSIFYENIKFGDDSSKNEVQPPKATKDKFISNIFKDDAPEVYKRHKKLSSDIRNKITYSNICFDSEAKEEEKPISKPTARTKDHIHHLFSNSSNESLDQPIKRKNPKNYVNNTTFRFDDPPEKFVPPIKILKNKYVSQIFKTNSQENIDSVSKVNANDSTKRSGIFAMMNHNEGTDAYSTKGIKTKYNKVDNVQDLIDTSSKKKAIMMN